MRPLQPVALKEGHLYNPKEREREREREIEKEKVIIQCIKDEYINFKDSLSCKEQCMDH